MAGRPAGNVITRYAGLQVQTSALGVNIPVGWGTFRCKCNLIDYLDFKSSAQRAGASGKGGSTTTGFTYSATLIMGVCEGPIDAISQVYVNGKIYVSTASVSAITAAELNNDLGAIGQSPWSYLTTNHPDHAIGYSGLVIAFASNYALGSSATTPNFSFEVVRLAGYGVAGTEDADPSLVVSDFFTNSRYGVPGWPAGLLDTASLTGAANSYQKYCLAAGLVVSPVLDQQRSATDFLNELLLATNSTVVWSEGRLKFIPYGDTALAGNGQTYTPNLTSVYSLNDDSYIVKKDGDPPILVDIKDQSDAYNVVQLEYLDRTNQYNMAIALASDAANVAQFGMRRKDPDTCHVICTPAVAAMAAQLWLQRTLYIRAQYKFTLGWMFALLEPGDLLEVTDAGLGLAVYTVRIVQIDEDEKNGTLEVTCEDYPLGVHNAPLYTMQASNPTVVNQTVDPGGVEANLLLWSQDWTNAAWTKGDVTVTAIANQLTAPSDFTNVAWSNNAITVTTAATTDPVTGLHDAQALIPTTANTSHYLLQGSPSALTAAGATFSCYVKAAGYSKVLFEINNGTNYGYAFYDLGAGTVTSFGAVAPVVVISTSITPVGGGWYMLTLSVGGLSATTYSSFIWPINNAGAQVYAGDGVSGIYAYDAQLTNGWSTADPVTGAADAQAITPDTANTIHYAYQALSIFAAANYTFSCYFKPNGYTKVTVNLTDFTANAVGASFDLVAGTVIASSALGTGVLASATIAAAGGEWQRVTLTFTGIASLNVELEPLNAAGSNSYAGDGVSGVFFYGAQLTQGVDVRPYAETTAAMSGPLIFNPPMALTPSGVEMWAAVAGGANWGGANVFVSYDGTTYEEVGTINGPSRFGALTASFASHADPDTADTLSVDLSASGGALTSAAQAVADASGTLCLINDAAPELISFETAMLTNPNRYNLTSYIRRGALNTPIGAHSAGAPFIRLDQAIFDFPYLATQAGKSVYIKFQSFNLWGGSPTPLSSCVAYTAIPVPLGARPPASSAWNAAPITITNSGQATPAILITGKSDNASASAVEFFYRQTGASAWISAGTTSNSATQFTIAPVQSGQTYDVAVAYVVNGVLGQLQIISAGATTTGTGGSGNAPGTALLNDSVAGTGKTFTCPAGSYAHVDIVITGLAGSGNGAYSGGKGGTFTDTGGGGGGAVVVKGFPVTPGTTVFTYTLPSAIGSDATCTASGLSLTAHSGTNSTGTVEGAGAAASTGNSATGATSVTAYAGHNGGLTDAWDGGGPGATINVSSGAVTAPGPDNTAQGAAGVIPGQGGAGSIYYGVQAGGGCNLMIIARS
jgi:hypothetical protein